MTTTTGAPEPEEPIRLLTEDEIALLTDDELAAYVQLLEHIAEEWTLTTMQEKANRLLYTVDELLFGGQAGAGKSEIILWHAKECSERWGQHRTLVLRSAFPELRRSLIMRSLIRYAGTGAKYKQVDKEWHFPNGSVIEFGYCATEEDTRQYLSAEYDAILIDESTDFSRDQIEMLRSRVRTTRLKRHQGVKPHLGLFTNPGGPGHVFHKERYVVPTDYGRVGTIEMLDDPEDPKSLRRIAFLPAGVDDNPYIDPAYKRSLMAMTDPVKRAQYLHGDWDVFSGQYFTEWNREIHVIPHYQVPREWPRIRCIDYGLSAPFCCLWLAFDWDGNAIVYRELYGEGHTATEQARMILKASRYPDGRPETIDYTVADPSIWTRTGTGLSIARMYHDEGLICRKAMNARVDGWSRVRDYLRGEDHPHVRILEGVAPNLVRTLPLQQRDKDNPEDLDTKGEDHACDTLRYGLMSRPRKARVKKVTPDTLEERMSQHLNEMAGRRHGGVHEVLGRT